MARVFGCEFPEDLWYELDMDVWLRELGDGSVQLGMTDPAATRAGRIVHVGAREGRTLVRGGRLATIESSKWVGAVPAPLAGTVIEVNREVLRDPQEINRDPYGAGWIVRLRRDPGQAPQLLGLLPGSEVVAPYAEKLRLAGIQCIRCAPL